MTYTHLGKNYASKKHPMLEYIFNKHNPKHDPSLEVISFTLKDISEGYRHCHIPEPASISNTILDLTRKNNQIYSRLPESIRNLGYDLRKKTGRSPNGDNYAGEFVLVGIGNAIQSWFKWPEGLSVIQIPSDPIPYKIRKLLRNDEGALFSVIDYCDVFSKTLHAGQYKIYRVQNPMKWQPNEIDGCYYGDINGQDTLFSVEAKALATKDDINLIQLEGGIRTMHHKLKDDPIIIVPLAAQMIPNGIRIAQFYPLHPHQKDYQLALEHGFEVEFSPPIESWR